MTIEELMKKHGIDEIKNENPNIKQKSGIISIALFRYHSVWSDGKITLAGEKYYVTGAKLTVVKEYFSHKWAGNWHKITLITRIKDPDTINVMLEKVKKNGASWFGERGEMEW